MVRVIEGAEGLAVGAEELAHVEAGNGVEAGCKEGDGCDPNRPADQRALEAFGDGEANVEEAEAKEGRGDLEGEGEALSAVVFVGAQALEERLAGVVVQEVDRGGGAVRAGVGLQEGEAIGAEVVRGHDGFRIA